MPRYEPLGDPDPRETTADLHQEVESLTSDGYVGLTALDGILHSVVGDLSDEDLRAIEEHFDTPLQKISDTDRDSNG